MRYQDNPKKQLEIAYRRDKVAALYLTGMTQSQIYKALKDNIPKISQATVSRDIEFITEEHNKNSVDKIGKVIAREAMSLDKLSAESYTLLAQAKRNHDTNQMLKIMDTLLKISKRRSELLGLDKPEKLDINSKQQIVVNLKAIDCGNPDNKKYLDQ